MICAHCGIDDETTDPRCGCCGWPGPPLDLDKDKYYGRDYSNRFIGRSPDGRLLESDPMYYILENARKNR